MVSEVKWNQGAYLVQHQSLSFIEIIFANGLFTLELKICENSCRP